MAGNGDTGRDIGRIEGKLIALGERVSALAEGMRELRVENTHDHGAVMKELKELRGELASKADTTRVNNHADRIDRLESERDKRSGADEHSSKQERRAGMFVGAAISLLSVGVTIAGLLIGSGGV